jgi:hypothetical protein
VSIYKTCFLVSIYKTCFDINSNLIRIKYKCHYFNRNVRVISKRNINITTMSIIRSISAFYIYIMPFAIFPIILID